MSTLFSILLGLFVGINICLFFRQKQVYHSVSSKDVKERIYQRDGKCYRLVPEPFICPLGMKHSN